MNITEKYRKEFEDNLHQQCAVFVTIGSPSETPRYINYGEIQEKDGRFWLKMESTQVKHIYFYIQITEEEYNNYFDDTNEFWEEFREFRNDFLRKNYPTIKI